MASASKTLFLLCALLAIVTAGCEQTEQKPRQKRPIAGDTVTPVILLGKTWKQNGPVLISARLQVQGQKDEQAQLLQLEDVPYEIVPRVCLTFFDGDKQLEKLGEVSLARDC